MSPSERDRHGARLVCQHNPTLHAFASNITMRRPYYSPASGFWPMSLGYLIHQPVVRISRRVIATKWRPQLVGYTPRPACSIVQVESRLTTASRASFPALLSTMAILCRQPCTDRQTRKATTNRDRFCSTVVPKRCSWGLLTVTTSTNCLCV